VGKWLRKTLLFGGCTLLFVLAGFVMSVTICLVVMQLTMTAAQRQFAFGEYLCCLAISCVGAMLGGWGGFLVARRLYGSSWEWLLCNFAAAGCIGPTVIPTVLEYIGSRFP